MTEITEQPAGPTSAPVEEPLIDVRGLRTVVTTATGIAPAVEDVSFTLRRGEVLGIVGESGSGKSLTVLSILRLVSRPVWIESGEVWFEGRDLLRISNRDMHDIRGRKISMIFQEPLTSLDASFTVGTQLTETLRAHRRVGRHEAEREAVAMLDRVGIGSAARRMSAYPHELSGGMRQRVMIAMSLLLEPKLLLADEPVTALDVTTQAQVLELILNLQREMEMAVIFISHDLGVVLDVSDRVAVMYAGQFVEVATSAEIFEQPRHPYTHGLLQSKLSLLARGHRIAIMPGQIPRLAERSPVCRFAPRCPNAIGTCTEQMPSLELEDGRLLRCFNPMTPGAR